MHEKLLQVLSRNIDPTSKDQCLIDMVRKLEHKKTVTTKNVVTGPIDGLKNKARPSVRGWKSRVFCKPRQSPIQNEWNIDMTRNYSTTKTGGSFSDATIEAIWRKATPVRGYPGYATEQCGAVIYRHSYGKTSEFVWEIDHILPVSKGGSDMLSNLQPLQWQNNRSKGAEYPRYRCATPM